MNVYAPACGYPLALMKALLVPLSLGVSAARHLAWYVSYHVNGETRPVARGSQTPAA